MVIIPIREKPAIPCRIGKNAIILKNEEADFTVSQVKLLDEPPPVWEIDNLVPPQTETFLFTRVVEGV